jgi:hypothetical protein
MSFLSRRSTVFHTRKILHHAIQKLKPDHLPKSGSIIRCDRCATSRATWYHQGNASNALLTVTHKSRQRIRTPLCRQEIQYSGSDFERRCIKTSEHFDSTRKTWKVWQAKGGWIRGHAQSWQLSSQSRWKTKTQETNSTSSQPKVHVISFHQES